MEDIVFLNQVVLYNLYVNSLNKNVSTLKCVLKNRPYKIKHIRPVVNVIIFQSAGLD